MSGFRIESASRYNEEGNYAELIMDPTGGTLETHGHEVRITYEEDGVEYVVEYEMTSD